MSAPDKPPEKSAVTDFVRKHSAVQNTGLFRFLNFELGARPNLGVAIPGTLLFVGTLAYFGADRYINGKKERTQEDADDDDEDDD